MAILHAEIMELALHFRRATIADAAALADIARQTFVDTYGPYTDPEDVRLHCEKSFSVEQQSKEIADPNYHVLLCFQGEELIAFTQVVKRDPPACVTQDKTICLYRYYVKKEWHGKGIATPLLEQIEQLAREAGADYLWLSMWAPNQRAKAYYLKVGFEEVGFMEYHFGTKVEQDLVLLKRL